MFFGRQLQNSTHTLLFDSKSQFQTIQITNAALSKSSQQADLYLTINDQEILVCELNRKLGILQNSLNLLIDSKDSPALLSRNGNIHVCGYYQVMDSFGSPNEIRAKEAETVTNKKVNPLEDKFKKAETLPAQTPEVSINSSQKIDSQITPQQTFTPRVSSRLSSRRQATSNPQPKKVDSKPAEESKQKPSKKQQKSQKKSHKSGAILSNGRYSLKALLENISDDDSEEESDEEFENEGEDEQSDDDSEFNEDEAEDDDEFLKKKAKQSSGECNNLKQIQSEDEIKQRPKRQTVEPKSFPNKSESATTSDTHKPNSKQPIEIGEESDDEKKEPKTEQFQQKWPQNPECHLEVQTQREKIIEELASKIKVPTKRPSF